MTKYLKSSEIMFKIPRLEKEYGNEIYVLVCPTVLRSQNRKHRAFALVLLAKGYSDLN